MKKLLSLLLAAVLLLSLSAAAYAETYTEGTLYYTIANESVTITGCFGRDAEVTVPASIAGYPVNAIASGAFAGNGNIRTVYLPDTITEVQPGAFAAGVTVVYNSNTDHPQYTPTDVILGVDAGGADPSGPQETPPVPGGTDEPAGTGNNGDPAGTENGGTSGGDTPGTENGETGSGEDTVADDSGSDAGSDTGSGSGNGSGTGSGSGKRTSTSSGSGAVSTDTDVDLTDVEEEETEEEEEEPEEELPFEEPEEEPETETPWETMPEYAAERKGPGLILGVCLAAALAVVLILLIAKRKRKK